MEVTIQKRQMRRTPTMNDQEKTAEPGTDDGLSEEELREMDRIARTPIAHLNLEGGTAALTDAEIDGMLAEAFDGESECVPPEIIRSIKKSALRALFATDNADEFPTGLYGANVRAALTEHFQRCADDALKLQFQL